MTLTSDEAKRRGRLGGCVTAARIGRAGMAERGAVGFERYCRAHHGGNRAAARKALGLDGNLRRPFTADPAEWHNFLEDRNR